MNTTPTPHGAPELPEPVGYRYGLHDPCYTADQMREYARAAIQQAAGAVTGWRLVPVEPTREMLNAAVDVDSYKLGGISPLGFRTSPQQLFEKCFVAMLAASPTPPPVGVQGWSPIETAPKDGTEVLGWREDAGAFVMRWTAPIHFMTECELRASSDGHDDWQEQEDWFYADFVQGGRLDGSEAPTHWMPLPTGPTAPGAQGEEKL